MCLVNDIVLVPTIALLRFFIGYEGMAILLGG